MILIIFTIKASEEDVYIHNRKNSGVYHSCNTCMKIKNHVDEIRKVTLKEAEDEYGRVACKVCR